MQEVSCRHCGEVVPRNESFTALDYDICATCLQKELQDNPGFAGDDLKPNVDPTICFACGADAGYREYQRQFDFPVCEACTPNFGNMPFPLWIKASAVAVLLFVVLSFGLNARFWKADGEITAYWTAIETGDFAEASRLSGSFRERVPEVSELQYLDYFSKGMMYLEMDEPRLALEKLRLARTYFPPDFGLDRYIEYANLGAAFDDANYDMFLSLCREQLEDHPDEPNNILWVASALACKYAETGEDNYRLQCRQMIDRFEGSDDPARDAEYINRIRYRLHSREIIDTDTFMARYPVGWNDPEGGE